MLTYGMTVATRGGHITVELTDDGVRLRLNTTAGETWVELSPSDVLTLRDTLSEVYARCGGSER